MKKIKLNFEDCWFSDYRKSVPMTNLINVISKKYEIEISDTPDYLICSCFGNRAVLRDCCRIFFAGENVVPNFNIYDYGIGFSHLSYGDRYIRYPLYALYKSDYIKALEKHERSNNGYKKFCNMVVSNGNMANGIREDIFFALNSYKQVDSGGKYKNNVGGPVKDKLNFQKDYKFSLAFENSSFPGYVTEKIVQAWAAGTIPIYWGARDIEEEFNVESFINGTGKTIEEIVDIVRRIDQDDALYEYMMRQPIHKSNGQQKGLYTSEYISEDNLLRFFENIFEQNNPLRAPREGSVMIYLNHEKKWSCIENSRPIKFVKKVISKIT